MHRAAIVIAALAVTAAVVFGILQARGGDSTKTTQATALSRAEVAKPIAGVPAQLADLRRRVNGRVDGGTSVLDAQLGALRGHPIVVNLWASWCGPCRFELPFFQHQALKRAARVAFLGVNVNDSAINAGAIAAKYPMPYPSFTDPDEKIVRSYGSLGLPTTVFYDAAGKRQMVHQGPFASERLLSDAIERYALVRAG